MRETARELARESERESTRETARELVSKSSEQIRRENSARESACESVRKTVRASARESVKESTERIELQLLGNPTRDVISVCAVIAFCFPSPIRLQELSFAGLLDESLASSDG